MSRQGAAGVCLGELLVALAIAALVSTLVLPQLLIFESRSLAEISRNDLHDRAERLLRFIVADLQGAAFLVGATPRRGDGSPLALVHDSLAGDPLELLPAALLAESAPTGAALTLVAGVAFSPPIQLAQPAAAGSTGLQLTRRPNQSPGSSRELLPAPEAIDHLVLGHHRLCYPVAASGLSLELDQPLAVAAPAGTEVYGVRAYRYSLQVAGSSRRLRRDDFTSSEILDDAVDGLQFEYLLADGTLVTLPPDPGRIRAVRCSLLVRDLRADQDYLDRQVYRLGAQVYGPYLDHYRRVVLSRLVEVKNHGLP